MKLDLRRLKLHPHESEEFYFCQKGRDELFRDEARFLEPIEVIIMVTNTGRVYVGEGKLNTVLELQCSRCLEKVAFSFSTEFTLIMTESKGSDFDDELLVNELGEVDIKPRIEEIIYAEIPLKPLCCNECKGICQVCGINKNISPCNCAEETIDPRWETLKKLL